MRRVHEDVGAGVDGRDRVDDGHGVRDRQDAELLGLVGDELQRRSFGAVARHDDQRLDRVDAARVRRAHGGQRVRGRNAGRRGSGAVRGARRVRARGIDAAAAEHGARQRHERRGDDPRPDGLAAFGAPAQLEDLVERIDRREDRREAGREVLAHVGGRLLGEPARGIALDDVAMRVDEARHHGAAAGVDAHGVRGGARRVGADARDAAVAHDDRAALDRVTRAVEDAGVADHEVLRRGRRSAKQQLASSASAKRFVVVMDPPEIRALSMPVRGDGLPAAPAQGKIAAPTATGEAAMPTRSWCRWALAAALAAFAGPAAAELTNQAAPVIVGHYHLNVTSVAEHRRFWVDTLGGKAVKIGSVDAIEFPGRRICCCTSRHRPARRAARRSTTSASRCPTCRR